MKKIISTIIALVMIAALCVSVGAVSGLPAYDGNYAEGPGKTDGQLNAIKDAVIQADQAGDGVNDPNVFVIPGVKGDAIPTIDGKVSEGEGYEDFVGFEDYLYLLAANNSTDFDEWYNEAKEMDLIVKTCWDGQYIYFYFEYAVNGYMCAATSSADLWQWNCIQIGLANKDAKAYEFSETNYGITSGQNSRAICGPTHGNYVPDANEDYAGTLSNYQGSRVVKKVTHEIRVDICEALDRDEAMNPGEFVKLCWVVMINNKGAGSAQRGFSFGHGITGRESQKFAQHFVRVMLGYGNDPTLGGRKPAYYTPTADEISCDYRAGTSMFFYEIKDKQDFVSNNGATFTNVTEENKYVTISTENEKGRVFSESGKYPYNLWATAEDSNITTTHAIIKYRTSSEGMKLGLTFKNATMYSAEIGGTVEFKEDNFAVAYAIEELPIKTDGQWHETIINLSDSYTYKSLITAMSIEITNGSIDIEYIKFFGWNPGVLLGLGDNEYDEEEEGDEGGTGTTPDTENPSKNEDQPSDPSDEGKKKGGCKSTVTVGVFSVFALCTLGTAAMLRKKE